MRAATIYRDQLELDENEKELLEHCIVQNGVRNAVMDRNAALADMRYNFIEGGL